MFLFVFLPEFSISKRSFGLFVHQAGTCGVNILSILLKLTFADSRTGKILTPKDLIKLCLLCFHTNLCILVEISLHELDFNGSQQF